MMTWTRRSISVRLNSTMALCLFALALLLPAACRAQLLNFSRQELIDYTAQNPFDRLPDGRPKVPDDLIERARGLSSEEVWAVLQEKGFNNQYSDGFQVLHPGKTMVGRDFTVQFMPARADVENVATAWSSTNVPFRFDMTSAIGSSASFPWP